MLCGIPVWLSSWFKRIQLKRDIYANGSKWKKSTCCTFAFMLEWNHSFNSGLLSYGCQELQQNGLADNGGGNGEAFFFFFFGHFAWLQSLKEEYNVEKNVNHVNSLSRRSGICMAVPVMRHGAPSGLFDETYQAFVFLTEFSALKTLLFSILQNSKWRFSVLSTPSPQLDPGVSEALQT